MSTIVTQEKTSIATNVIRNETGVRVITRGVQGLPGDQHVFIQDTPPVSSNPYLWFDTSGGNLSLWVETGA